MVILDGWQKLTENLLGQKGPFPSFMQVLPGEGWKMHSIFAMNSNQISILMVQILSIHTLSMPTILDLLAKSKCCVKQSACYANPTMRQSHTTMHQL